MAAVETPPGAGKSVARVGCVVLASGASVRFGANKLLAPLQGKPLLMHTLEKLRSLPLARVVVVSPHPPVQRMAEEMGFSTIAPEGPGQNDTVCAGIQAMAGLDGCLFSVGDQPLCTAQSMLRLLRAFETDPTRICRLYSGTRPGNPVLFPAALFPALENLPRDKGGSWLIRRYPELLRPVQADEPAELLDVDTPEKLAAVEKRLQTIQKER